MYDRLIVNGELSYRVHDSACNTYNHYPKGPGARIISAPSRKGGVSTSGPCSEG